MCMCVRACVRARVCAICECVYVMGVCDVRVPVCVR